METIQKLDSKTFKEIYKNEKLRNSVAYAHGVADSNGNLKYMKALSYPISYKVTEEQIKKAKTSIKRK